MILYLENDLLKIAVSEDGAELQSIYGKKEQQEYLWQGDKEIWGDRAPNLFPYIARLTEGTYHYQGKPYQMRIHGFVKYRTLKGTARGDELIFELPSDEDTYRQYPFHFIYRVRYLLEEDSLHVTYEVENRDEKTMYFGVGGHPGFNVPFAPDTAFEDYELVFEEGAAPQEILFSEDCFVTGEKPWKGPADGRLALRHDLFDHDAIVLKNPGREVRLVSPKSRRGVTVWFPQMKYLGIWHMPHTEAPYVCIEPWSSLPSRKGVIEDLEKQQCLISLPAGETYRNNWSITIA